MLRRRNVAPPILHRQFHHERNGIRHRRDDEITIEDLDLRIGQDVGPGNDSRFAAFDPQRAGVRAVILDDQRLDVENDIGHVFDDPWNRRKLVLNALQLDPRDGAALKARQQNPAQAVPDRHPEAALERLGDKLAIGVRGGVHVGNQPAGKFQSAPTNSHLHVSQ
jgi:hypothetical protein